MDVPVEHGNVRPVAFDGDDGEALLHHQLAGDAVAHAVELGRAVRGLADHHDACAVDAGEQGVERRGLLVEERLACGGNGVAETIATARLDLHRRARAPRRDGVPVLGPALGADERHEANVAEGIAVVAVHAGAHDPEQLLRAGLMSHGDDESPADAQLFQQRFGNLGATRGDDDRVVRRALRKSLGAVARHHGDVVVAQPGETGAGDIGEGPVPFDGMHRAGHAADDGAGVSGAGAHLQDAVCGADPCGLEHQRHDVGLRDGLSFLDGKGAVFIGKLVIAGAHEFLAGNLAHGGEHQRIHHATRHDLRLHHLLALFVEGGGLHVPHPSSSSIHSVPRRRIDWR